MRQVKGLTFTFRSILAFFGDWLKTLQMDNSGPENRFLSYSRSQKGVLGHFSVVFFLRILETILEVPKNGLKCPFSTSTIQKSYSTGLN